MTEKTYCQNCGEEVKERKKFCDKCHTLNVDIYYAYRVIRFNLWEYLKQHGKTKTREIYNEMVDEEGEKWTREVLGDKLIDAILEKIEP